MPRTTHILLAAAAALFALPTLPPAIVGQNGAAAAQDVVGVRLSARERERSVRVRLPDGRVVLRPVNSGGIPWLYGFGDVYGNASGLPLVGGVTPSVLASTASGGIVPGQNPR